MHAGTDFTPIFIQPESDLDVVMISDRTPTLQPNVASTPSSYSIDNSQSGSGQSAEYYLKLADILNEIEEQPTPDPIFVAFVSNQMSDH